MAGLVTLAKAREERRRARRARTFRRRVIALAIVVVVVVALVLFYRFGRPSPGPSPELGPNKVLLRTSMGDITIQLYDDMPITTSNFKKLVKQGIYDGTIFHPVEASSPREINFRSKVLTGLTLSERSGSLKLGEVAQSFFKWVESAFQAPCFLQKFFVDVFEREFFDYTFVCNRHEALDVRHVLSPIVSKQS